jgi:hypothetical protein
MEQRVESRCGHSVIRSISKQFQRKVTIITKYRRTSFVERLRSAFADRF